MPCKTVGAIPENEAEPTTGTMKVALNKDGARPAKLTAPTAGVTTVPLTMVGANP